MVLKYFTHHAFATLKSAVFVVALLPMANLVYRGLTASLGANPIEKLTHSTGYWTLVLLLASLSLSPIRRLTRWTWLIRFRRMLGLFAFFYGCGHFLMYLAIDQFFDVPAIAKDILKRPYITVGFAAFMLMCPLAMTSTDRMIHWLGGSRWRLLHRLVYICAIGGVLHYIWLVKKDRTEPLIFAGVLALLLMTRVYFAVADKAKRRVLGGRQC